jgi:hypothetical protein
MAVKAQLNVQLFADSVLVAESDDPQLWRNVFAAIQSGRSGAEILEAETPSSMAGEAAANRRSVVGPVAGFANELEVTEEELVGACGPTTEAPYIHLDQRYWEALRRQTGSRGIDAVAPVALAATLLAIWFKHAQIGGNPSVRQCQEVLATIGLRDQNAARSLTNAEWLQSRNGTVQINPAQWSQAVRIGKAYCLKKSPKELQTTSGE